MDGLTSTLELGLDTFGDVTVDAAGEPLPLDVGDAQRRRRGRARRPRRARLLRHRRAPPQGLRRVRARRGAGGDRRPDEPDPPRIGGHGAQLRRSGARVPALLHARRRLEWPCRGDPRPRLVHRVVPALRLRARAVRAALRGEAAALRGAAQGGARDLVGHHPRGRSRRRRSTRRRPPAACRPGSRSAAARSRSCAPRTTGSR